MTGRERIEKTLAGEPVDRLPVMPIIHTALAGYCDVPLGRYFTVARSMADVIVRGSERFGFDGVQLTLGVACEPEAFGAKVEQPPNGAPLLKQRLLSDPAKLADLRLLDPTRAGRMPMYQAAVREAVNRIGGHTFVVSTLRGPLNMASQLRGVEDMLIDMLERPAAAGEILDFTLEVAIKVSRASLESGAHGLMFGEATCSPNFISPAMYRRLVQPRHKLLMSAVKEMGWRYAGLHVCGNISPILEDLIATGADLLDVDHQVDAPSAIRQARGRVALRGNLDPVTAFFQGSAEAVRRQTETLIQSAGGARWILSSGCDIPPGTPAENVEAFCRAAEPPRYRTTAT